MSTPEQLYRMPPNPGFVGGYNWTALILGLNLLIMANVAATIYVGNKFGCQQALGEPLFTFRRTCVHPPHYWAKWLLQHGNSPNSRVRLHILGGALIVILGASATVAAVYALNLNRARQLSANSEDLHGSARWANRADIEETGLLDSPQGGLRRRLVRCRRQARPLPSTRWPGARSRLRADTQREGRRLGDSDSTRVVRVRRHLRH